MGSEDLFDKLKSLGVQLGAKNIPAPQPRAEDYAVFGIEKVIHGSEYSTIHGGTFLTMEQFAQTYRHGEAELCSDCDMEVLAAWSKTQRILSPGEKNVVFLDTETSGLAGGTGTYAFLVGIGYRTDEGFELVQFFMRDPAQEPAMLAALDEWLSRFDAVVTFNGKTFDVPLLTTRYRMNGLSHPFDHYEHVDVLHIARKVWRDRLPSRALGALEKDVLHFHRTTDEVPGWLIPQLYFDYLHSGDARPLAGVFYHNAIDILTLAVLYHRVGSILKDPLNQESIFALDLASVARLYESMGWIEEAARLFEYSLDAGDLPQPFFIKTIERFAHLRRRQNDWQKAVSLWRTAAEHGYPQGCVELAKYYEHRERNDIEALFWAKKALQQLDFLDEFDYPGKTFEQDLQQRIGRLYNRINKSI